MLNYFKCMDCLTAFTSESEDVDICACGGKVIFMGQVHGFFYGHKEDKCECDERCSDAQGPTCNCKCGGINHGTGLRIEVLKLNGKIKVKTLDEKSILRATEWREIMTEVKNRFDKIYGYNHQLVIKGKRIPYSEYMDLRNALNEINHLKTMKVHSQRIKKAKELFVK